LEVLYFVYVVLLDGALEE